jgi:hypothetical protein
LNDIEITAGAITAITKLLVAKGILTAEELQEQFLVWIEDHRKG